MDVYGTTPRAAALALIELADLSRIQIHQIGVQEGNLSTKNGVDFFSFALGDKSFRYWAVKPDEVSTMPDEMRKPMGDFAKIA